MRAQDAIAELNSLAKKADNETRHANADDVLVEFLKSKGYVDVARAYEECSEGFWYA